MIAEEIIRKDKYKDLKNLVLICEAMDEFAASVTKEKDSQIYLLKSDLSEVKRILNRVEASIIEDQKIYSDEINELKAKLL